MDKKNKNKVFKKRRFKVGIVLLLFIISIQFFRPEKNEQKTFPFNDFLIEENAPENLALLFKRSCYNCHSNNTTYYWYNEISPASWFVSKHIKNGKKHLNFSEWTTASFMDKRSNLSKIATSINDNYMPLRSYTIIHQDAKLSEQQKKEILEWLYTIEIHP